MEHYWKTFHISFCAQWNSSTLRGATDRHNHSFYRQVAHQELVMERLSRKMENARVNNAVLNHVPGIHDGESCMSERAVTRKQIDDDKLGSHQTDGARELACLVGFIHRG